LLLRRPDGIRVYGNVFVDRIADVYNGVMYRECGLAIALTA
jgi:hypothetical protein